MNKEKLNYIWGEIANVLVHLNAIKSHTAKPTWAVDPAYDGIKSVFTDLTGRAPKKGKNFKRQVSSITRQRDEIFYDSILEGIGGHDGKTKIFANHPNERYYDINEVQKYWDQVSLIAEGCMKRGITINGYKELKLIWGNAPQPKADKPSPHKP